ncbi:hypothetical protein AVEN_21929-1 [Araneus ventricosus]|uniref:HTH psq-type domain-containing protein n=1 Tax=Araneus ventricosus TaxID=182803 RepID=A0A4Y2D2S7_ARAVE|nr:hypothetical protein AVEN_21929-1 [Araneus ventricosus]
MQILYVKYVSVHVCVGGANREIGLISARKVRRISFASTPRRISWCYFAAIGKIQIVTVKMSNHQRLDDGMRWRIVGRLEGGQSQVQICREFNLTPSVVCNLWKQFETVPGYRIHREKAWARSSCMQPQEPLCQG